MFVNNLQICVILILLTCATSEVLREPTFRNVTLRSYAESGTFFIVRIKSSNTLKERIDTNWLQNINNIFGDLPVLRENSMANLRFLEDIEISNSNLNEIEPGAFRNLNKLKSVKIVSCRLQRLEKGVFSDLPMTKLSLNSNNISSISPEAFANLTNLRRIDLSHNVLSNWNELWFFNTPNLHFGIFSNNLFEELPEEAFQNVLSTNQVIVSFEYNKIVNVGQQLFQKNTKIDYLDLSYNNIRTFGEDVLDGVEFIDELDLSGNYIKCFSGNWSKILVAKMTNLRKNPIKCGDKFVEYSEAASSCVFLNKTYSVGHCASDWYKMPLKF